MRFTRRAASSSAVACSVAALLAGSPTGWSATPPAPNTFVPTVSMGVGRAAAAAALLPDGDVLEVGGGTASATIFDPVARTWTAAASLPSPTSYATAVVLPSGKVLVAGGTAAGAELYDPASRSWSLAGSMGPARAGATVTLLPTGDVLVAGGHCDGTGFGCDTGSYLVNQASAELYNPTTNTWQATGSMAEGRDLATATLLADGEVLVAGGFNSCDDDGCSDLAEAELYDPATGTWATTGSMHAGREQHTATLLPGGDVLVAGGYDGGGLGGTSQTLAGAEIYDPATGTWATTASMHSRRYGHTATLLADGTVLVAGGLTASAEVYVPGSRSWVSVGAMDQARTHQTATALPGGLVLVAGGRATSGALIAGALLYHPGKVV